jgi:hypothetical protein
MKRLVLINFVVYIAFFTMSSNVFSDDKNVHKNKSIAKLNIEVFDSFCILNQDNFSNIDSMILDYEGKLLEAFDPAITNKGKQFAIKYEDNIFYISYLDKVSCGVYTKQIDIKKIVPFLVEKLFLREIHNEESLTQKSKWYRVQKKGPYIDSLIVLTYGDETLGFNDGSITFMLATAVQSLK